MGILLGAGCFESSGPAVVLMRYINTFETPVAVSVCFFAGFFGSGVME